MAPVCSFDGWTALFGVAIGIAACLLICLVACAGSRRRLKRAARLLGDMPLPVLPPLPGLDLPPREDALEAIEGIGPEIAELLRADGIRTFDDLAQRGPARVHAWVHEMSPERMGPADPASWVVQARLLAQGRFEAFAHLARTLEDGRVPLEAICEPAQPWRPRRDSTDGPVKALRAAGVRSVQALARHADAEALARAMRQSGGVDIPAATVAAWIERAILFERGDEQAYLGLVDPRIAGRMGAVATPYPLTDAWQAALDRRTVAFSQAVSLEFDAATLRWREAARVMLGRESDRACVACRRIALPGALALAALLAPWLPGVRPPWRACGPAAVATPPRAAAQGE